MISCPKCKTEKIYAALACHTYKGRNGTWMSCMPCDSAINYSCEGENCFWLFTHGLNVGSPRVEKNEENRPQWIVGELEYDKNAEPIKHPDVKWYWEDEEE